MAYYENGGLAEARLSWTQIDVLPSPSTVIIDDTDPDFRKGGAAAGWRTVPEGYGGQFTWAQNNDREYPDYNWAGWYPSLTAGQYEVLVFIPLRYPTTSNARYWIVHGGKTTLRAVDQLANGNRWVSLGTFWFDGTPNEYVLLSDITFESSRTRLVVFDAVKWVPR